MLKRISKSLILLSLLTQIIYNKNIKVEEEQLKTILVKYFSDNNTPILLGSQFYKNKNGYTIQIDIKNMRLYELIINQENISVPIIIVINIIKLYNIIRHGWDQEIE